MPRVTIKTGTVDADGREETLSEYLCDWPGCPHVAVHLLGVIAELRLMAVVCSEHTTILTKRRPKPDPL